MKHSVILGLLLAGHLSLNATTTRPVIRFANLAEGKTLVISNNAAKGPFDIQSRLGKIDGTLEELQTFQQAQVGEFTPAECDSVNKSWHRLLDDIERQALHLPLPDTITMVKTTQLEEGGAAAYTQGDVVFLNNRTMMAPGHWREMLLAHELFHTLTRNNPDFRRHMYNLIGFTVLDEDVVFPEDVWARRITNPDVERHNSYVMLPYEGRNTPHAMLLMTNRPYEGGSFFKYLAISLIPLTTDYKVMTDQQGNTIVRPLEEVPEFWEKVGRNTDYVIDPEECLADNFAYAVTGYRERDLPVLPNPELTEAILSLAQSAK